MFFSSLTRFKSIEHWRKSTRAVSSSSSRTTEPNRPRSVIGVEMTSRRPDLVLHRQDTKSVGGKGHARVKDTGGIDHAAEIVHAAEIATGAAETAFTVTGVNRDETKRKAIEGTETEVEVVVAIVSNDETNVIGAKINSFLDLIALQRFS